MKNSTLLSIAIAIAIIVSVAMALSFPPIAVHSAEKVTVVETKYLPQPALTPKQAIWLARLLSCESGINGSAINKKDRDNTPSWGILQFKPGTFNYYTEKYGITGDLMDEDAQVAIVIHWILYPENINWSQQFPVCISKLGVPPVL